MQSVILRGKAPPAVPAAIARDARLCVACLHENRSGAQSCEVCGTSLLLILCGACEVVNGPGALHCHGCGAALGTEARDKPARKTSRRSLARLALLLARANRARAEVSANQAEVPLARRLNFARLALIASIIMVTTAGLTYAYLAGTPEPELAPRGGVIEVIPVGGAIDVTPVRSIEVPSRVPPPKAEPRPVAPAAAPSARVTHTGSEPSQAVPPKSVADQKSDAPCSEAVSALGLCSASARSTPVAR